MFAVVWAKNEIRASKIGTYEECVAWQDYLRKWKGIKSTIEPYK